VGACIALCAEVANVSEGAFGGGGTVDAAFFVSVVDSYSAEPVISWIIAWIRKRFGWSNRRNRRPFRRSSLHGRPRRTIGYRSSCGRYHVSSIAVVYVMITNMPLRTIRRIPTRTPIHPSPTFILRIIHAHTAPIMIRHIVAPPHVRRTIRPPRTLLRGIPGHEPIPVTEPRVAIGVGEAFDSVLVSLAFFGFAGGAVLAVLAVLVVPFEAAEEAVFGSVRPDGGVDVEEGCSEEEGMEEEEEEGVFAIDDCCEDVGVVSFYSSPSIVCDVSVY